MKSKKGYLVMIDKWKLFTLSLSMLLCTLGASEAVAGNSGQDIRIRALSGKQFDGIGAVNGGGATAVLLKDYPEPQRSQIMDLVYKPMFGASLSALLVEIPGDGNSTQGSMPSHSHFRGDHNYWRGYTWWVMREAKKRGADNLSLDATSWSAPAWVGNIWSKEMVDYYLSWLQGLRQVHGLELDALGCHNEKGYSYDFAKWLRQAMNNQGFKNVKLHGFDNWGNEKVDFISEMQKDEELREALDVVSAHTFNEIQLTPEKRQAIEAMGKPIWNSEDHVYLPGFDCLIKIVKCFNENYIISGATKVVNWYDIAGVYPLEPYSCDPAMLLAREPWSGSYEVREALWGYAHYGQFTRLGWQYVDEGCVHLDGGGTMVMLRDKTTGDYSLIAETSGAKKEQTIRVRLPKGLSSQRLCVWASNEKEQFVRLEDIKPRGNCITLTLSPATVYSLSTLTGQQKGGFAHVPASEPFPIPYEDDFDQYTRPAQWGYLPHYLADIIGCFELVEAPGRDGMCIRQTVGANTLSWAPEWHHYTILGDAEWSDYEVSADVYLNPQDEAAVMGRICHVGYGYGVWAKGYFLKLDDQGNCTLVLTRGKPDPKELIGDAEQQAKILSLKDVEIGGEYTLATAKVEGVAPCQWHSLKLRFLGDRVTGYVDGREVVGATSDHYTKGMAGLLAPQHERSVSTPYFDHLRITPLGSTPVRQAHRQLTIEPLY
jgi:galactosylceramidase